MPLLVRKIEKGKWHSNKALHVADIRADAITKCMRTSSDSLSTWQIDLNSKIGIFEDDTRNKINDKALAGINEAVLALATGPSQRRIDAFDIVLLEPKELENGNLEVVQKDGITLVGDLKKTHHDIVNLTYAKLGIMAKFISREVYENNQVRRSRLQIIKTLINAIQAGRLDLHSLHENIQKAIIKSCDEINISLDISHGKQPRAMNTPLITIPPSRPKKKGSFFHKLVQAIKSFRNN